MAAERLSMRRIREVLRLDALGLSRRSIARSQRLSHNTVGAYLERAAQAGLSWATCQEMDDATLEARLFPPPPPAELPRPLSDWATLHRELRKKGVTLQLLWLEYKAAHPQGYQYTQFATLYRRWKEDLEPVLRQEHKAGEKAFVDYAGQTVPIIDATTGEVRHAQL